MKKTTLLLLTAICLKISIAFGQAPSTIWAKGMGSSDWDNGRWVAIGANTDVYYTGQFSNTVDFDPSANMFNLISNGGQDVFVSRLDSAGNFIWAKRMGGINDDGSVAIAIDLAQNIYVFGNFSGTASFGTYNLTSIGGNDIFICKLDSSGNFIWARRAGGTLNDEVVRMAIDYNSDVIMTGGFNGTANFGTFPIISNGQGDIFISKIDSSGTFLWAKSFGGTGDDFGIGLTADALNNLYAATVFHNTVTFGTTTFTSNGYRDNGVLKLDASGNVIWAKRTGGTGNEWCTAIGIDNYANIYIGGDFQGTVDFDPSSSVTYNLTSLGIENIYIAKWDSSGNFIWTKRLGGSGDDYVESLSVDDAGNVYSTGAFTGICDFDPSTSLTFNLTAAGQYDIFISKLDSSGNFGWAKNCGGTGNEWGGGIALDAISVYVTGYFQTTSNFNIDGAAYNLTSSGNSDIFIQKLSQIVTGINELSQSSPFQMYPNPTDGIVNFISYQNLNKATLKVYNAFGQLVFESENIHGNSFQLNLNQQANGIYFITISSEKETYSTKIIIQR